MTTLPLPEGYQAIAGFEFYCISSAGVVLSCRKKWGHYCVWKRLVPSVSSKKHGRLFVNLIKDGKRIPKYIHRLVLENFRGPCPEGLEACHNDGDPFNNSLSNLRWDTHTANMADRTNHGRYPTGSKCPGAKLTEESVLKIRKLRSEGVRRKIIASMFGVSLQTIWEAGSGRNWKRLSASE